MGRRWWQLAGSGWYRCTWVRNFLCPGTDSKYVRLCWPDSLCCKYSTELCLCSISSHRQQVSKWAWLYSSETTYGHRDLNFMSWNVLWIFFPNYLNVKTILSWQTLVGCIWPTSCSYTAPILRVWVSWGRQRGTWSGISKERYVGYERRAHHAPWEGCREQQP